MSYWQLLNSDLGRARLIVRAGIDVFAMGQRYRGLLICAGVASVAVALVDGVVVVSAVSLFNNLAGNSFDLGRLSAWLMAFFPQEVLGSRLVGSAAQLLLIALCRQILTGVADSLRDIAARQILVEVRRRILSGALKATFADLDRLRFGRLKQVFTSEIRQLAPVAQAVINLIGAVVSLCVMFVLMLDFWPAGALGTLVAVVALFGLKSLISPVIHHYAATMTRHNLLLMEELSDAVAGIRQIKLYNRNAEFLNKLNKISHDAEAANLRGTLVISWEPIIVQISLLAVVVAAIFINAHARWMPIAGLLSFLLMLYRCVPFLLQVTQAQNKMLIRIASVAAIKEFFLLDRMPGEIRAGLTLKSGRIEEIRVSDVSASYGDRQVLNGVSMVARCGELIGIVGRSGSGKSTLAHVLVAMYPYEGSITFDGVELRELDSYAVRAACTLVSQDAYPLAGSIGDTIRGGANLDAAKIEQAARLSEASGFIRELPKGYNTVLGKGGHRLSGGQQQRLSLAQGIARDTSVVILDESTSALDGETEERVLSSLDGVRDDKIMITITHRVERLKNADRLYVLDRGRVVESGSWAQLTLRHDSVLNQLLFERNADEDIEPGHLHRQDGRISA